MILGKGQGITPIKILDGGRVWRKIRGLIHIHHVSMVPSEANPEIHHRDQAHRHNGKKCDRHDPKLQRQ